MTVKQVKQIINDKNFRFRFAGALEGMAKQVDKHWRVFVCDDPSTGMIGVLLAKIYSKNENGKEISKLFQEQGPKMKHRSAQELLADDDFEMLKTSDMNTDDYNGYGLKPEQWCNIVKRIEKYLKIK